MILLDTHVLVRLALEPEKLSKRAREAIREARQNSRLAISGITLWELAWLVQNGRIQVSGSIEAFVRECASKMAVLAITPEIAVRAVSLPENYPKDPQDRLIGSTSMIEGIPLVTEDRLIRKSGLVETIW